MRSEKRASRLTGAPAGAALVYAAALLSAGCSVFDEQLYKSLDPGALDHDGGMRGDAQPGDGDAGMDSGSTGEGGGDGDAGGDGTEDAGPPHLADLCNGDDVFTLRTSLLDARNQVSFIASTADFRDNVSQNACFDYKLAGSEGFMSVEMVAGERWHFHIVPMNDTSVGQAAQNPVVYMRNDCTDNRGCNEGSYLDLCGDGQEEHFTFEAPTTGAWHFALDDRNDARGTYSITAVKPGCGNDVQEHNESCDTPGQNNCSRDCRLELTTNNVNEREPNDDWTMANILLQVGAQGSQAVKGSLGGVCDRDMFAFQVPAGGSVSAVLRKANGESCPDDLGDQSAIQMELIGSDSQTMLGRGVVRSGACPSIDATDAFADNLEEGLYYVRLFGDEKKRSFGYELTVTVASK